MQFHDSPFLICVNSAFVINRLQLSVPIVCLLLNTRTPSHLEILHAAAVQTNLLSCRLTFGFLGVQLTRIPFMITYKLMYRHMTIWLQIWYWYILPWASVHSLSFVYLFPILRFDQLGYILLRNRNIFLIWHEKGLSGSLQAMA